MYIKIRGRVHGPLAESQVALMIQQGKAGKFNEVSVDGIKWSRASDFPNLFPKKISRNNQEELQLAEEDTSRHSQGGAIWFLSNDGVTGVGPYSVKEILALVSGGKATNESLVWIEGNAPRPLKEVSEFKTAYPTPKAQPSAGDPGVQCSACKKMLGADASFCPHCGVAQLPPSNTSPLLRQRRCPTCKFPQETGATACPQCGCGLAQEATQVGKSRLVYLLLALLLLGGFGVHNFYAGRKKQAIIQLILGLTGAGLIVSYVWALSEAFSVRHDGEGVPFLE